ncbi:putative lipid-transfer protein DIR1 [Silene latifolia]|uniref:putative lipid-transfer protein DIR1 n=1 Tax=Silene latifolia TaxID=37657 RepID=UPI003D78AD09
MASKLVMFLVVMVAVWGATNGVCNLSPMAMFRCMPAVSNDNPTNPSSECCNSVNSLSSSDFQCLCDYKNNHPGDLQQYGVNATRAAQLPASCKAKNAIPCS